MAKRRKPDFRPENCPQCGSINVAEIIYNKFKLSDEMKADLAAERVVRGGFHISLNKPDWRCMDCGSEFFSTAS